MADGFIQVAPDSTGKKMETTAIPLVDGSTVHRERVTVGDDDTILPTILRQLIEINYNTRLIANYIEGILH